MAGNSGKTFSVVAILALVVAILALVIAVSNTSRSPEDLSRFSVVSQSAEGPLLTAPQPRRIVKGGVQTLVVTGFVTNRTAEAQTVPNIILRLVDKNNEVLQDVSLPPDSPVIQPNSTIPYKFELQNPVEPLPTVRVDFD